ncbi:MAG: hypothetical protein M3P10_11325 [Actinomycetota bacterium]|nr:hypothetical protein [Actinomycetota bacterium]
MFGVSRVQGLGRWTVRRVHFEVSGRVQGVSIVAWCRIGPAMARVESVQVREESLTGEHAFRVTR